MSDTTEQPNILFITSDQQHWNTIGAFNEEISTPNLDRLIDEGMYFDRTYCPNPTCTPSRSSIITGEFPSQHGAWSLGTKLQENRRFVGDEFKDAGYQTALIGKAHFQPLRETEEFSSIEAYPHLQDLEFWKHFQRPFYGFDHVELTRNHVNEAHVGQHYALWLEEKDPKNWRNYFLPPTGNMDSSQTYKWPIPEDLHYNTWIAERTNHQLEKFKEEDENFFLWTSFLDPHPEYLVPEPWDTMYDPEKLTIPNIVPGEHRKNPPHFSKTQEENPDFTYLEESGFDIHGYASHKYYGYGDKFKLTSEDRKKIVATYYGMVSMMDKYIGKILDKLEQLGLKDNTLVVFTSDHGHFFGQHGLQAKGGFHYEDLIKVPFIARFPNTIPAGKRISAMQSLVDLAPTFLSFCNIDIPKNMSGKDQKDVWKNNKKQVTDHVTCEFRHEETTIHQKTYINERYKITVYYNQTYGELFDLKNDPNELNNLWDDKNYIQLKSSLLLKYIWAELEKERVPMPRIAQA